MRSNHRLEEMSREDRSNASSQVPGQGGLSSAKELHIDCWVKQPGSKRHSLLLLHKVSHRHTVRLNFKNLDRNQGPESLDKSFSQKS